MAFKAGLLFLTLLVGSLAFPVDEVEQDIVLPIEEELEQDIALPIEQPDQDMSIFFDHSDSESRIVGGSNAPASPHMVALVQGANVRSLSCGGSLLNQRHVLTAAHCLPNFNMNNGRIVVGTARWAQGGAAHALSARRIHPSYNANTIKNDIGILVTSSNVALNNNVRTVVINWNWVGAGVPTRVTGWGRVQAGGSLSQNLLVLDKQTIDGNRCVTDVARRAAELNIRAPAVNPNLEICTFHSNGRGTCNGDSGGPLLNRNNNQQIGIVSWGLPCARNAPDMFVRLSAFRNWVQQNS